MRWVVRAVAYFVLSLIVFLIARWLGASAYMSGGSALVGILFAAFLVEVLWRGLVAWIRVVRSG